LELRISHQQEGEESMPPSTTSKVVTVMATAIVATTIWTAIPKWVKDSIFGRKKDKSKLDANDELANPTAILVKLSEVLSMANDISNDVMPEDMTAYKLQCCFLSMIHLMNEFDSHEPSFRESFFSQGGQDVTESDLEPLGKYLDLAHWAYRESLLEVTDLIRPLGYKLIRFDSEPEPGRVGHFVAVNHSKKEVVISIKGTNSLSDVLTDLVGKAVEHSLAGGKEAFFHEGIYTAANMMFEETGHLVENFYFPQDYKVTICGHSLGAGVSSLFGIMLKDKFPTLKLQVYAFATPACCSLEVAAECEDFVTSVVNNNDCVPRLSLLNLRTMYRLFMLIDSKLAAKGLSPVDWKSAKKYIADITVVDSEFLMTSKEFGAFLKEEVGDSSSDEEGGIVGLYVPGKIVSIWNHTKDASIIGGKITHAKNPALRQIFVESNMVTDHKCDSYRQNLQVLAEQTANTI